MATRKTATVTKTAAAKAAAKKAPVAKTVAARNAAVKTPAAARPAVTATPARPAPRKASGKTAVATKAIANKPAGKKVAASKPQAVAKPAVAKESVAKKAVTRSPAGVKTSAAKARKPVAKPAAGKAVPARRAAARPARVPVAKAAPRNTAARKLAAQFNALSVEQLKARIEVVFDARAALTAAQIKAEVAPLVKRVVTGLESGEFRVAQPLAEGGWQVNEWLKKAVLLYFRINDMEVTTASPAPYWDKVEARFAGYDAAKFREAGVRVVPGAIARRGTYFGKDVVLMPSFTNIGAYVGEGTMVDTWATVGSCAQIGKHCHLSGGAGIGGVLEPLQASPTIIEDHCFIGARSEVVEGVIVGHHSVIGMGVFLSQSTRIYNRATGEISYGYIPPYSVVVSGSLPSKDGSHSLYCAVIVKQVDEKTIGKTSINELLRGLAD
nr:2,3,4,5-tetrahydropyridine-2,6-dicarboxylate N-succinyltransferase [Stenotrophomonas koreensis]